MSSADRLPIRLAMLAALALAVAGCGFRPLYAPPGDDASPEARAVSADLAAVSVAPIPNRQGQELRNRLTDILHVGTPAAGKRYTLSIGLGEQQQSLAVRQTGLATRANLYMYANYTLFDATTGQAVVFGSTSGIASYDLLDQDFATLTAINDARTRVIARLADNIRNRLAVHFAGQPAAVAGAPEPPPAGAETTATGMPAAAAWPESPTAIPPMVLVPSPATEPTIAAPAPAPLTAAPPSPAAGSEGSIGPVESRPDTGGTSTLP